MKEKILITGGAGFIGSHLADQLLKDGYAVRIFDNLTEQVHSVSEWPGYLDSRIERVYGDVRDATMIENAVQDVSAVYHLAAAVGVGQSMYQINHYTDVNNRGTAVLLEALIKHPGKKLVVASSMSLYGEGMYQDSVGNHYAPAERDLDALKMAQWELTHDHEVLLPLPTPESKTPSPSSVYALSKYDQERLCLMVGSAYKIPTTALRFFNVYGPRQALSNPYTGVLAIFSSRFMNNKAPVIFEDGRQRRDFVSVHDIVQGCVLALENANAEDEVFNIGSGENYSISEIATKVAQVLECDELHAEITGEYRVGDIRHCFADISKAKRLLGYRPRVSLEEGLQELAEWLHSQRSEDRVDRMRSELLSRGLSL